MTHLLAAILEPLRKDSENHGMKVEIVAKAKEDVNSTKFKDLVNLMKDGINNVGFSSPPSPSCLFG